MERIYDDPSIAPKILELKEIGVKAWEKKYNDTTIEFFQYRFDHEIVTIRKIPGSGTGPEIFTGTRKDFANYCFLCITDNQHWTPTERREFANTEYDDGWVMNGMLHRFHGIWIK